SGTFYRKFCEAIGRTDLASDPRFATTSARQQRKDILNSLVADIIAQQSIASWLELLERAAIPAAPIQRLSDVLAHPQTHARQYHLKNSRLKVHALMGCHNEGKRA